MSSAVERNCAIPSGDFDVLIAGGGNAALCAAITARLAGAKVLLLECAGQLSSFHYQEVMARAGILGFGAAEGVKFRGMVRPPAELIMMGRMVVAKPRTARFEAQGLIDGTIVFQASIIGVVLRPFDSSVTLARTCFVPFLCFTVVEVLLVVIVCPSGQFLKKSVLTTYFAKVWNLS